MKQTLTQRIEALESQIMRMRAISIRPPYTAQASTSKQTNTVCCHCEKEVNKPLTDSKPIVNKELREVIDPNTCGCIKNCWSLPRIRKTYCACKHGIIET